MKTLELKDRKVTTRTAVSKTLEFFENFDLSAAEDVADIRSEFFDVTFDLTGQGCMYHEAAFYNKDGKLKFWLREKEKSYSLDTVFDNSCIYINFKEMMCVFEKFVERLNMLIDNKEADISGFLDFLSAYKNK